MVLYGGAIGFLPASERLRFYEERATILGEWVIAKHGDPKAVAFAIEMTMQRLALIRKVIREGGK